MKVHWKTRLLDDYMNKERSYVFLSLPLFVWLLWDKYPGSKMYKSKNIIKITLDAVVSLILRIFTKRR